MGEAITQTMTRRPPIGEANLAALIAAVIGCIGGLFALGIAPSIIRGNVQFLAATPMLNVISFFLCGILGWLDGGQIGPRLQRWFGDQGGLITGGIIGGLIPVAGMIGAGWYLSTH
jgi:hypothetical protein